MARRVSAAFLTSIVIDIFFIKYGAPLRSFNPGALAWVEIYHFKLNRLQKKALATDKARAIDGEKL